MTLFSHSALTNEDGWLQYLTAFLYICAGAAGFSVKHFSYVLRTALLVGGAWLAMDEAMMCHECFKITVFQGWHSPLMRDTSILMYAVASTFLFIWMSRRLKWSLPAKGLAVSCMAVGLYIVLHDVMGGLKSPLADECEEVGEAALAALISAFFFTQGIVRKGFLRAWVAAATLFAVFSIIFIRLRPAICERLYRSFHSIKPFV